MISAGCRIRYRQITKIGSVNFIVASTAGQLFEVIYLRCHLCKFAYWYTLTLFLLSMWIESYLKYCFVFEIAFSSQFNISASVDAL